MKSWLDHASKYLRKRYLWKKCFPRVETSYFKRQRDNKSCSWGLDVDSQRKMKEGR